MQPRVQVKMTKINSVSNSYAQSILNIALPCAVLQIGPHMHLRISGHTCVCPLIGVSVNEPPPPPSREMSEICSSVQKILLSAICREQSLRVVRGKQREEQQRAGSSAKQLYSETERADQQRT